MSRTLRSALPAGLLVGLLAAVVVLLLGGPAFAVDVAITDDGTDPDPVVAEVGEQVTFVNETDRDVRLIDDEGRWDSGDLSPGESFTITFDAAGTVTFTSADGILEGTIEVGTDPTAPVEEPTADEPADEATAEPVDEPSDEPLDAPTAEPIDEPTTEATTEAATEQATEEASEEPADGASETATPSPAPTPSEAPTGLAETGAPAAALLVAAVTALGGGLLLLRPTRRRS